MRFVSATAASDAGRAHTYGDPPSGERLPIPPTLFSYLAAHAAAQPQQPYLTIVSGVEQETLAYGELDAFSQRAACWCHDAWQLRPGDVVGFVPANDLESVIWLFALLRAGCAVVMLNRMEPAARTRAQAASLNATRIARGRQIASDYLPEATVVPELRAVPPLQPALLPPVPPDAPAMYFGTSGSTAVSKLVAQSHYNAAVNAYAASRHHRLGPGDRVLGCLPFYHVNGVHFTLFATLAAGAHAVVMDAFDPFAYMPLLQRVRPRIASLVPSLLESLLDARDCPSVPGDFGYFVSAAAPLTSRTARAVWEKLGARVIQGYGLTETTNFSTTLPIDLPERAYRQLMCDAEIPSVGVALYGNDVEIIRKGGERAAMGEVGEVCMRGHNVMLGYEGNRAATEEAFRDGWFHSQDLGMKRLDADTGREFVVLTGRIKNIAKVGGEAVSLDEMERALRAMPDISDAACVAVPHRLLGDEVIAAVVSTDGVNTAEIGRRLRAWFPAAALPRRIVRLSAIPRTPTGKIRRGTLAEELLATSANPHTG